MRELKFRAWDKKAKKWLLGYNLPNLGGYSLSDLSYIKLMQYTGLKDKNGVEIYEGDILKVYDREEFNWGVVKFGDSSYDSGYYKLRGWYVDLPYTDYYNDKYRWDGKSWDDDHGAGILFKKEIGVIGNIYENPELLEK